MHNVQTLDLTANRLTGLEPGLLELTGMWPNACGTCVHSMDDLKDL